MSNVFQTHLKGFKLNKMVIEQKMAQSIKGSTQLIEESTQPIEPIKELFDLFNSISWKVQKPSLSSGTLVRQVEIELHPVDYQSKGDRGSTVTFNVLNANGWWTNQTRTRSDKPPTASLTSFLYKKTQIFIVLRV